MNTSKIRNAKNFDELLDIKYGRIGTEKRDEFEEKAQYYVISEIWKIYKSFNWIKLIE
jgi:hypothetical protein